MRPRRKVAVLVGVLVALETRATAEPYVPSPGEILHLKSSSEAKTAKGSELRLPPGWFLDEPTYTALEAEMKRLQDAETRLDAENKKFRERAKDWRPGWVIVGSAMVTGFIAGYALAK